MTDKEKIRAWVKRREELLRAACKHSEAAEMVGLLSYIDSMQEEPVVIDCARKQPLSYGKEELVNNGLDLGCGVIWKQEPVSEDMWEASKQYALRQVLASIDVKMTEQAYLDLRLFSGFELAVAHKDGATWQKEQFEKNRLKHCDSITNEQAELEQGFIDQHFDKYQRMPTFLDAIEYGMNLQKQQIILPEGQVPDMPRTCPLDRCPNK